MVVPITLMLLALAAVATAISRLGQGYPGRGGFLRGLYRYESDLGWPHGVQEEDRERAWLAGSARSAGDGTDGDPDAWPPAPVPVTRVKRA